MLLRDRPSPVQPLVITGPLTSGQWGIYLLRLSILAVKLPRVLADTSFSGKSFQSLMVFGRDENCQHWVRHWIGESCCEWSLPWRAAVESSYDLSTLTSSRSILWSIDCQASFLPGCREGQPRRQSIAVTLHLLWRTNLAAVRCTFSSMSMLFLVCGSHTEQAYSQYGSDQGLACGLLQISGPCPYSLFLVSSLLGD